MRTATLLALAALVSTPALAQDDDKPSRSRRRSPLRRARPTSSPPRGSAASMSCSSPRQRPPRGRPRDRPYPGSPRYMSRATTSLLIAFAVPKESGGVAMSMV